MSVPVCVLQSKRSVLHFSPINAPLCSYCRNINNNGIYSYRTFGYLTLWRKVTSKSEWWNVHLLCCQGHQGHWHLILRPLCARQEYILGRSHTIYSYTHSSRGFEVSNQIKVHVSGLWEKTGAKAHTGPGEKNISNHHIGSKPKPKPSRQEATGLITAGIKPEIQTTSGAQLRFTSLVNALKYSTTCDLWHVRKSVFISLTWKRQKDYEFLTSWLLTWPQCTPSVPIDLRITADCWTPVRSLRAFCFSG